MYNQYRSTKRSIRIVAAAAALVTVWSLFNFVALLADGRSSTTEEVRAAHDLNSVALARSGFRGASDA